MIASVAERVPVAVGLKVTLTVQVAFAAREAPQVVVRAKSEAFVPLMAVDRPVRVVEPTFLTVTVCAALVVPTF